MNNHSALVNQVLLEITKKYPHCRVWKTHTGEAFTMESVGEILFKLLKGEVDFKNAPSIMDKIKLLTGMMRRIKFGQVGQSDITGIMRNGPSLYIEVKTGTGRLSDQQKAFKKMVTDFGHIHIECRKLSDLEVLNVKQGVLDVV